MEGLRSCYRVPEMNQGTLPRRDLITSLTLFPNLFRAKGGIERLISTLIRKTFSLHGTLDKRLSVHAD